MLSLRKAVQRLRPLGCRGFHDPLDHVTGLEKRELLAHLAGDCDPFRIMSIKKDHARGISCELLDPGVKRLTAVVKLMKKKIMQGPGTRERPNLIPSAYCQRLLACSCCIHDNHLEFMWLHMGCLTRCGCGYWFLLCPVAPL